MKANTRGAFYDRIVKRVKLKEIKGISHFKMVFDGNYRIIILETCIRTVLGI